MILIVENIHKKGQKLTKFEFLFNQVDFGIKVQYFIGKSFEVNTALML